MEATVLRGTRQGQQDSRRCGHRGRGEELGALLEERTPGRLEGSMRGGEPAGMPAWGCGLRNGFVCISRA